MSEIFCFGALRLKLFLRQKDCTYFSVIRPGLFFRFGFSGGEAGGYSNLASCSSSEEVEFRRCSCAVEVELCVGLVDQASRIFKVSVNRFEHPGRLRRECCVHPVVQVAAFVQEVLNPHKLLVLTCELNKLLIQSIGSEVGHFSMECGFCDYGVTNKFG